MTFKPLLAATLKDDDDVESVLKTNHKLFASPKLDGVRCLIVDGVPVSRNLKPIRNQFIQDLFTGIPAMDGELIIGDPRDPDCFNKSQSGVMSQAGPSNFKFYVFDIPDVEAADLPFEKRYRIAYDRRRGMKAALKKKISLVPQTKLSTMDQVHEIEQRYVSSGFEGIMLRTVDGAYKHGRSTLKEGILMKLKRFETAEAKVVGFEPLYVNENGFSLDKLGRQVRTSHKKGLVETESLGALVVKDIETGTKFSIGTGFTLQQRIKFWETRDEIKGKVLSYKFQKSGTVDKPRFPVFLGWRLDLP